MQRTGVLRRSLPDLPTDRPVTFTIRAGPCVPMPPDDVAAIADTLATIARVSRRLMWARFPWWRRVISRLGRMGI